MKKFIISTLIVFSISLPSCDDYLDLQPLDQPGSETFLSNETEVVMAINAIYRYLDPGDLWSSRSYTRDLVNLEDAGQVRMSGRFNDFRTGSAQPTWGMMRDYYSDYYKGISRAHIAIDGMEKAKESMTADGKLGLWNQLRAEARVMRAFFYYNLVSKFGAIPFTRSQLEMNEYANLERTPEDEIYQYIFDEIGEAAEYLQFTPSGDNVGRITKGAAYAIGARAALYRAFFHDGKAIAPETQYLEKVRDWTQRIIDSGTYALYYDPDNPRQSYRSLFTYKGENSSEMVLQKEFNFTEGKSHDWMLQLGSRNLPNGFAATTPQEYLIHSYEDTLGNTVDESPFYDPRNPFFGRDPRLYQTVILPRVDGPEDIEVTLNTPDGPLTLHGFNEVWPGSKYPDAFNPNLMREYKTMLKVWADPLGKDLDNWDWWTDENGVDHIVGNQDATNPWSSRTGYLTYKYWDISDYPNNQTQSSLNMMLIRYADVLLMNAEARIELNDNLAQATEYMNMIRARGYGMNLGEYLGHPSHLDAGLGQAGLREVLRRERKVELCFEGLRYDDLKRYGAAVKALSLDVLGRPKFFHREDPSHIPVIDENAVVTLPWLEGLNPQLEEYPNRWWMFSNYKEYFNRWPIPQTEFDNGKALTAEDQNPGYLGE